METIKISKKEYESIKKKAELNENLLIKLIRGLEDIKAGRVRPYNSRRNDLA